MTDYFRDDPEFDPRDYLSEEQIHRLILTISDNLARSRYEDFDALTSEFKPTEEQEKEILAGKKDPAEVRYELAKRVYEPPIDELLSGPDTKETYKNRDSLEALLGEPDPHKYDDATDESKTE